MTFDPWPILTPTGIAPGVGLALMFTEVAPIGLRPAPSLMTCTGCGSVGGNKHDPVSGSDCKALLRSRRQIPNIDIIT